MDDFVQYLMAVLCGDHLLAWRLPGEIEWRNTCLNAAFEAYNWNGVDFETTQEFFGCARAYAQRARDEGNDQALRVALASVLAWGGSSAENVGYLIQHVTCDAIENQLNQINEVTLQDPLFVGHLLRSNAGFSKIYSVLEPSLIIYDSRVAAALGMIAAMFAAGAPVHRDVRFPAMSGRGRQHRQAWLGDDHADLRNGGAVHMAWNIRASRLLATAMELADAEWCRGGDGLRRVEAGLFMVGYDLPAPFRGPHE